MPSRAAAVVEIRPRDADRSREEILRAAMTEFAENGFAGARIDAIAERAGVNKKLIYYYFAAKDELFVAVLEQTYADIRAAEQALHLEASDPVQAIRTLVAFTWRHYLEHPEFLALLNSENMHRAGHLKRSGRIRQMNSPLIETLATIVERGRRDGSFRAGVDPLQLYVSIAGLAYFYLSNNHTLSAIFGRSLMTPAALDERLAHITAVVLGYLTSRGPQEEHD
ncbi:MAG TPA: TetR/AcrR family transcriptional regulator [Caldimonas sp.]|nr:TetR/AcrR family transcriptional regulator [Caldimonas sp.]HEX2541748.1 TetR/AcrR family transcriptional regulator [Caldimonas sp.]